MQTRVSLYYVRIENKPRDALIRNSLIQDPLTTSTFWLQMAKSAFINEVKYKAFVIPYRTPCGPKLPLGQYYGLRSFPSHTDGIRYLYLNGSLI